MLAGGDTRLTERGVVEIDGPVDDRILISGSPPEACCQMGQAGDIRYRIHTRIPATPAQLRCDRSAFRRKFV